MIGTIAIVLFVVSLFLYFGVGLTAYLNDRSLLLNKLFFLTFSIFGVASFLFVAPELMVPNLDEDLSGLPLAILGLSGPAVLLVGFFVLALTGQIVRHGESILADPNSYVFPGLVLLFGLVAVVGQIFLDNLLALGSFVLMFVAFGILGERGTQPFMEIGQQTDDMVLRKRLNLWGYGLVIFGVLSAVGWLVVIGFSDIFEEFVGDAKASLILPSIATFVGAAMMFASFRVEGGTKADSRATSEKIG